MNTRRLFDFNVWPVVQRELREGARRPFNYWLRVASAGGALWVLLAIVGTSIVGESNTGLGLFLKLHTLMLGLICVIVPTMTADCLAREKREGTLGLMFLTPLNGGGIVLGKSLVQALRAFTLWLAALPILVVPFVVGGIGRWDVLGAITIEFSIAQLCLMAGLLASSLATARAWAFALGIGLGFLFVGGYAFWTGYLYFAYTHYPNFEGEFEDGWRLLTGAFFGVGGSYLTLGWTENFSMPGFFQFWQTFLWQSALLTPIFTLLGLILAGRMLNRSRRDKIPSVKREGWVKRYCRPIFQRAHSRRMQRSLDRNPIAWLQAYSWKARLTKWSLCLIFIGVESLAQSNEAGEILLTQAYLLLGLATIMTFVGVSTFLQEKRNGALELLLVTPIRVEQIIFGRAWGMWKQFFPAVLIVALYTFVSAWLYVHGSRLIFGPYGIYYRRDLPLLPLCSVGTSIYLSLPIFTTYFALRVKNMIVAAILTWAAVLVSLMFGYLGADMLFSETLTGEALGPLLGIVPFTLLTCFLLRHSLSRRIYSF